MNSHAYTIHDYYGKNNIDIPCHIFQLWDHGVPVYTMNFDISEGETPESLQEAKILFEQHCEMVMDGTFEEYKRKKMSGCTFRGERS